MREPAAPIDAPIRCPVCRAVQPPQPLCRRCGADLRLFCRATDSLRRAEAVLRQDPADRADASSLAAARAYLQWLSPAAGDDRA